METVKVEVELPKEHVEAIKKLVNERGWWCRGFEEFVEEAIRLHYRNYQKMSE